MRRGAAGRGPERVAVPRLPLTGPDFKGKLPQESPQDVNHACPPDRVYSFWTGVRLRRLMHEGMRRAIGGSGRTWCSRAAGAIVFCLALSPLMHRLSRLPTPGRRSSAPSSGRSTPRRLDSLLGKILRIRPLPVGTKPYTIPSSNPFRE
jgi:hypothetical protein